MAYANPLYDDFRHDEDRFSKPHRRERQREREYYRNEHGAYLADHPQFGAADGRHRQGNDEHYDHRHDPFGPAYGTDEYQTGAPLHHAPRRPGSYSEGRYFLDRPEFEHHGGREYGYGPQVQTGVGIRWRNRPGFLADDDAAFWTRQHSSYPAYSPAYLGGAYPGGEQAQRNWVHGFHTGEHDRGNGYRDVPVGRERVAHPDPDYHQWRLEQIRNLDRDYDDWRQERYSKFSDDFNTWRSSRAGRDPAQALSPSEVTDTDQLGPSSTATATAAGIKK